MREIGLTLGVVESRVSQIHSSAVVRLRATLQSFRKFQRTPGTAKHLSRSTAQC
jgi:hypothetical protein